jgi:hypothetical protein
MLLQHSQELLDTAAACARAGRPPADMTVLVGQDGGIQIVAASDWPLDSLRLERGAEMAFRVWSHQGRVGVTGQSRNRTCRLESETPAAVARRLLRG